MDWLRQFDAEKLLVFTLVLTRVSGLLMTAPVYGTADVPMTVRALLAAILSLLVMPAQLGVAISDPGPTLQYVGLLGGELLVGVCLGLGILILLSGMQMAGELMCRVGGLTLSDVFDPTFGDNVPLFSRLLALVSTAVFVAIGGHRMLMAALLDTFRAVPPGGGLAMFLDPARLAGPGGAGFLEAVVQSLVTLVTESFSLGIRVSAPVLTAVLLATLVLGLISRTLPQLNILMIGFGLNSMLTFAVFFLSLGVMVPQFRDRVGPTVQTMLETLRVPMPP